MTLSVSALVGIVLACVIVAIFATFSACMWWGRRRRGKDERCEQAEKLAASRGLDEEQIPPELESIFDPVVQSRPGSVFDRAEGMSANPQASTAGHVRLLILPYTGRMAKGDGSIRSSLPSQDPHLSSLSSGALSSPGNALALGGSWAPGIPSGLLKSDSTIGGEGKTGQVSPL